MIVSELVAELLKQDQNAEVEIAYTNRATDYWGSDDEIENEIVAVGKISIYNSTVYLCEFARKDSVIKND